MPVKIVPPTPSAYPYPLLIKHLLHAPMVRSPDQEIVYRDLRRRTYRAFRERIGRLASGLSRIGVEQGDVVAVFDWDSDRYHECYFAVPMMGAILQTINVSLTPDDIAYTLNDTRATTILFNVDFLPLIEKIKEIHKAKRRVYGAPRIHAELRMAFGVRVGRKRVERLMRTVGISGLVPKKRGRTTISVPGVRVADDLVERRFKPDAPNVLWVADFERHAVYQRLWQRQHRRVSGRRVAFADRHDNSNAQRHYRRRPHDNGWSDRRGGGSKRIYLRCQ